MTNPIVATATTALGLLSLNDVQKTLPSGFVCGVDSDIVSGVKGTTKELKPPCPPKQSEHYTTFEDMYKNLTTKLTKSLPSLSQEHAFWDSLKMIADATKEKNDAIQKRDEISKQKPVDPDAVTVANQAVTKAEEDLAKSTEHATKIATIVLDRTDLQHLMSDAYNDVDLLTFTILKEGTTQKLAQWCDQHPDRATQLTAFLQNESLMRLFLQSGGARNGEYGRAVEIYHQIQPTPTNSVLERLRLAVALELCSPYQMFDTCNGHVDPLQRYIHYEQAYLLGELDAYFSQFTVWEMRQIINSDATEEELEWGRVSLRNYRPDLIHSDSPQWRYCLIVKTDVAYAVPDWYKSPRTFDQILSGGGKCGPRAWYGRFICKAFGIPTWGVKQPGHAAMTRWTSSGEWCTCLGAGFPFSHWDGECGLNFVLSTQAMRAVGTEVDYTHKVRRLEWIGSFCYENSKSIVGSCVPDCNSMWWSLSYFQRKRLASNASTAPLFVHSREDVSPNMYDQVKSRPITVDPISCNATDGTITIPANAEGRVPPPRATNNVILTQCYAGGNQLFIKDNGFVEYNFKSSLLLGGAAVQENNTIKRYQLICCVCTVHRKSKPITLVVSMDGKMNKPLHIELPYTLGMWKETDPVEVEWSISSNETTVGLRIVREHEPYGFALQHIKLVPV